MGSRKSCKLLAFGLQYWYWVLAGDNWLGQTFSGWWIKLISDQSAGPSLLAWTIFPFLIYLWNLRATVYGGSTLVTKVV